MVAECECPTEHTIAKLGHCRTCPFYKEVVEPGTLSVAHDFIVFQCGGDHRDGSPHDFGWATYADATTCYGVCRCGYDDYTHSMLTMP